MNRATSLVINLVIKINLTGKSSAFAVPIVSDKVLKTEFILLSRKWCLLLTLGWMNNSLYL